MGCGEGQDEGLWQVVDFLTFRRTLWSECDIGSVTLDLHPGGHFIPHGWIGRQLDELLGRPPSYPRHLRLGQFFAIASGIVKRPREGPA